MVIALYHNGSMVVELANLSNIACKDCWFILPCHCCALFTCRYIHHSSRAIIAVRITLSRVCTDNIPYSWLWCNIDIKVWKTGTPLHPYCWHLRVTHFNPDRWYSLV